MKRLLLLLGLAGATLLPAFGQNLTTVTSTNITNGAGVKLSAGKIYFTGEDSHGNVISYQIGGGGQVIRYPITCSVTQGVIAAGCHVANVDLTNPASVCFDVTVKDTRNTLVLGGPHSGYNCVQPQTSNSWCQAGQCNFDQYVPNIASVPIAKLPPPGVSTLGGVYAVNCQDPSGQKMTGIGPDGRPVCGTDQSGGTGSINFGTQLPTGALQWSYFSLTPPTANPGLYQCAASICNAASDWVLIGPGTSATAATWGGIGGTLSNQADLQLALNGKLNVSTYRWGSIPGTLSDQTDLWNVLAQKVNASNLALVATSGNYNDLSQRPVIPGNNGTFSIQFESPTTADTNKFFYPGFPAPLTLTRITCNADGGTVAVNLAVMDGATWAPTGTNILAVPVQCGSTPQDVTVFALSSLGPQVPLALSVLATSGLPSIIRVRVYYQVAGSGGQL